MISGKACSVLQSLVQHAKPGDCFYAEGCQADWKCTLPALYCTMHMVRKDEAELAGSACDCKNGNDSSKHIEDTC